MHAAAANSFGPAQPNSARAPRQRDLLVDVARGIAISLVVLGHTNQGVMRRGWYADPNTGLRMDMFIYAFHMPAFFFLSGLFVPRSLARKTTRQFIGDKAATLLYPYLLWGIGVMLIAAVGARVLHHAWPAWRAPILGLLTGSTAWFLLTLFFVMMVAEAGRRLPGWAFFLVALTLCYVTPFNSLLFFERGVEQLPFFAAGVWLGQRYGEVRRVPVWAALLLAAMCLGLIVPGTTRPHNGATTLFLVLGFLGTAAVMLLARSLGESWLVRVLAWAGSASLGIFLLAAFVQGGVRAVLTALHVHSVVPQLLLPSLAAVVVPAWFYHRRKPLHMEWMFEWPF